jgi:hypothetical protein
MADGPFFDGAMEFARRQDAPPMVLDVIRFRRAVQEWRPREALEAAERLALVPGGPQDWIALRDLIDGGVVSAVELGRSATAKVWLAKYGDLADWAADDIVSQIIASLVEAAPDPMPSP